jgi:hypothetical protein
MTDIEVRYEPAKAGEAPRHERTLALHACRIEHRIDDLAFGEQYLIRCRCHSSSWQVWQPGDPPFVCPSTLGGPDRLDDVREGLPRAGPPPPIDA